MTPERLLALGIDPALTLLPPRMTSDDARAMILAIALQESKCQHRRQLHGGPARSYVQFERAGIAGVLSHRASAGHAVNVCQLLDIEASIDGVYTAIEFNDVLMATFARLLLWTLPRPLPLRDEVDEAWRDYLEAWRPGKPHPETWRAHYADAWACVDRRPS